MVCHSYSYFLLVCYWLNFICGVATPLLLYWESYFSCFKICNMFQINRLLRPVWYMCLNICFQFLNNIIRISTHFFTYTYFQKIQITLLELHYQTGPWWPINLNSFLFNSGKCVGLTIFFIWFDKSFEGRGSLFLQVGHCFLQVWLLLSLADVLDVYWTFKLVNPFGLF